MKRIILALCAGLTLTALVLTAFAAPEKQLPASIIGNSGANPIVVGTLSLGPCEMSLASDYTRTQVVLEKAGRRLKAGAISLTAARFIADKGRNILSALDAICPLENDGRIGDAWTNRDHVRRAVPELEILVGAIK